MRTSVLLAALLLAPLLAMVAQADDSLGRELHDQHCVACHTTDVYTRKDHFIHSLSALEAQVGRCSKGAAKVDWDSQQIGAVVKYLNDAYYHF